MNDTRKCTKCGADAEFVQGMTEFDREVEQYHCPKCHHTFITTSGGKFVRDGHIDSFFFDVYPYMR